MSAPAQTGELRASASDAVARFGRFAIGSDALLRFALVGTALVYFQTITFGFVYDDPVEIEMNPWIQSWKFWRLFFTGDFWSFGGAHVHGNYYRPLILVWLTGNYSLFKLTPGWWHLTSMAAHLIATALVYLVGARLLRDRWTASIGALLFGINPVHVEPVSWVSSIPEILMTIFFLGALLSFQHWRESNGAGWVLLSAALYSAALLSKETGMAFLPVVVTYAWMSDERTYAARLRSFLSETLPFVVVTVAYMLARAHAIGAVSNSNYPRSVASVLLTWPAATAFYLGHLFWPFRLSVLYNFDLVHRFSITGVVLPLVVSVAALVGVAMVARKAHMATLALVWIAAPLVPVLIGIKYFQWHDYVHDRYLYLPSVMAAVLLAVAIKLAAEWIAQKRQSSVGPQVQIFVTALLAVVFAVSAMMQSRQWESDLALFSHAHQRAPRNPLPTDYLARTLSGLERTDEAIAAYKGLLQDDPDYWQANYVLGLIYYQLGRYDDSEKYLEIATRVWPRDFIHPDAAQFYYLGLVQQRKGEYLEAEASLRRAVELHPTAVGYCNALGTVLQRLGRNDEAEVQFRREAENRKIFAARQKEFGVEN